MIRFYLITILASFGLLFIVDLPDSYSKPMPKTNLELYLEHDMILVGKVASVRELSEKNEVIYEINVERFLKNPQDTKIIFVFGPSKENSIGNTSIDKIFEKGDRVFLFLIMQERNLKISIYSSHAGSLDFDKDFILPPLILYKAGVDVRDIVCRSDLILVTRLHDNSPMCVINSHIPKLVAYGIISENYL